MTFYICKSRYRLALIFTVFAYLYLFISPGISAYSEDLRSSINYYYMPGDLKHFRCIDLYGRQFNLRDYTGKTILLNFFDKSANYRKSLWADWLPLSWLNPDKVVLINVYYPAGIFFASPRGRVITDFKKNIIRIREHIAREAGRDTWEMLNRLEMRFIMDWNREITGNYQMPRQLFQTMVYDVKGEERGRFASGASSERERFKNLLKELDVYRSPDQQVDISN